MLRMLRMLRMLKYALYVQVEAMLDSALLMQTWLLGDGHPSVTGASAYVVCIRQHTSIS
jgi:hypothetical protein